MAINVYLNNSVRELPGFKSERLPDNSGDRMTFNGVSVHTDKGHLYMMWGEVATIPDDIKGFVEKVSCYEVIPQMGRRESGIYRHESAECELTPEDYGNAKREKPMYRLKVTAKSMDDIKAILHKVKTGTIRPEESYEGPQGGKTRRELENELAETQRELGAARATIEELREKVSMEERLSDDYCKRFSGACEKNAAVREFVDELVSKGTWMVRSARVVRRLSQILNSK